MTSNLFGPSPYLQANFLSRLFHSWIYPLLQRSQKQNALQVTDLYNLLSHLESTTLTDQLETNWFNEIKRCKEQHSPPSLIRATLRTMGWKPLLTGLLLIPNELSKISQPVLLVFLMRFFEPCSMMPFWLVWLLVFATVFAAFLGTSITNSYFYRMQIYGLQMRIAYSGLIFRKLLRLSSHSMKTLNSGQMTNLLTNDAGQIEWIIYFINYLWVAPLEILLTVLLFWYFVKYITFIAVGYTVLLLLLQLLFGRLFVHLRTKVLKITDERAKLMSEIFKSMRTVKMYCWETLFEKKIRSVRKREIIQYSLRLILDSFQTLLSHTYINVSFLMLCAAMWSLNIRFDVRFFAIASCMLSYMRLSVVDFFHYAIRYLVNYIAAQKRIKTFLLLDESQRDDRLLSSSTAELTRNVDAVNTTSISCQPIANIPRLVCDLKQAQWEKNGPFLLKNVVFNAHPGDLVCVIGSVGSGKSSLLQTLSGEITYFDGKIRLSGSFCYVPQEPWIFSSTVKNNILFGKEYDRKLFQRVVHATALDLDFEQLSNGSNTLVGDQGVMLSGGQKSRVNLARALYRDADIYLLDDPLSAVDVEVSKHLFEKSIKKYLHEKICILATHQIQFLQDATMIIFLNNGEVEQIGTYEQLLATSSSFANLLHSVDQHEQQESPTDFKSQQSTVDSACSEDEDRNESSTMLPTVETKKEGSVSWHVYHAYWRAGVGWALGFLLILIIYSVQQATFVFSNWWLVTWSDDENHRYQTFDNCDVRTIQKNNSIRIMTDAEWKDHRNNRFYIYCGIVIILFVITLIRVVATEFACLNAGRVLHNKMFQRVIRTPISFFDSTPSGRITNRFTKDVTVMDDSLPITVFDFLQCLFQVLGTVMLVGWFNPWSFIPAVIAFVGMLFIRYRFAQCSRDLKRLDSVTRSSMCSHLASTVQGLQVIQSYRTENMCSKEFLTLLDANTSAYYLSLTANRWAAIRFDWIGIFFIAIVTTFAVIAQIIWHNFSAGDIALTLSSTLILMVRLQWTIRQSVEVESQMIAVERVLEYCSLPQEPPSQLPPDRSPPPDWPSYGNIVFDNVSMRHESDAHSPFTLRHISMAINAGEKVGIVGRTGAGKSSLIQTLFRMGSLTEGQITIDNIDISTVGLNDVRRGISIIPQDPLLFKGTLRSNLDPFNLYSDAEIWYALEQVQLKIFVTENMKNGLQSIVNEDGSNLSVGQKQLVCLARAILKKAKILVMDEASANVDNTTDELLQRTIRDKFLQCTVLTVAHRLRTVIESDRILVLENGEIVEFDTPDMLLNNSKSRLTSLVEQTGPVEAERLRTLANVGVNFQQKR